MQDFFLQQYHWCSTMMEFSRKMIQCFFHASVFFRVLERGFDGIRIKVSKINLAKHITSHHVTSPKTRWWFEIFHFDMFIPIWGKIPILAGWICMRYLSFECLSFAVRISEKFWIEILNSFCWWNPFLLLLWSASRCTCTLIWYLSQFLVSSDMTCLKVPNPSNLRIGVAIILPSQQVFELRKECFIDFRRCGMYDLRLMVNRLIKTSLQGTNISIISHPGKGNIIDSKVTAGRGICWFPGGYSLHYLDLQDYHL